MTAMQDVFDWWASLRSAGRAAVSAAVGSIDDRLADLAEHGGTIRRALAVAGAVGLVLAAYYGGLPAFFPCWPRLTCRISDVVAAAKVNPEIRDRTGRLLGYLDPSRGRFVRMEEVPLLADAIRLAEDERLFERWIVPVDVVAVARAFKRNLKEWRVAEGGSTIPQQVAAIYFPLRWTGLRGKIAEAAVGSWLSVRYTRSKILELYLNRVFLSRCYGVDCAARSIFGKGPEQLGPSEVALLAKMLPGPAGRDPARNPGRADQARCLGLEVLAKKGVVSAFEADQGCRTRPVTYDPKVTVPAAVRRMIGAESGCGLASVGVVASGIDRKILSDLIRLAARFTDGRHQFDGVAVDRAGRLIGAVGKPDERGPIWSLVKPISTMIAVDAGLATLDQSIGSTLRGPYGVSEARWIATLTPCDRMRGLGRGLGWSDNCGGVGAFDLIRGIYRKRFAAFGLVVPGAELANGLGVAVQANLFEIAGAYTALVRPAVPAAHVSRGCGRVLPAPVRESTARGVFKALEATVRTGTAASAAAAWPNRSVPVAAKTGTGPREHLIAMVTKDIVVVLRVRSNRRLGGTAGSNLAPAAMGLIRRWYVRS